MTEWHEPAGTSWAAMRVMLAPGDLLVAREGLAILVADARTDGQEATADRLLDLCVATTRTTTEGAGERLVRSASALLAELDSDDVPALGLVTVDGDRLLVTLTRGMALEITDAGGVERVDAERSLLPVTRVVAEAASVALGPDPARLAADRRSNLSGGVVRAGGLLLEPGAGLPPAADVPPPVTLVDLAPAPPVPPSPPQPQPQPQQESESEPGPEPTFTVFSLHADAEEELPAVDVVTAEREAAPGTPLVRGIVCSRGHFNPPDARFCERCGISMVHQTHNVVTGARPPLGVLVVDDGAVHTLSRDYVIGRDPDSADEVRSGRSAALVLDDPDLSLSRVHARLVLDGWEVRVEDAGSVNGTFVADAGSDEWRQLEAERPTTIEPGCRLRMGSRVLTYESHHKS